MHYFYGHGFNSQLLVITRPGKSRELPNCGWNLPQFDRGFCHGEAPSHWGCTKSWSSMTTWMMTGGTPITSETSIYLSKIFQHIQYIHIHDMNFIDTGCHCLESLKLLKKDIPTLGWACRSLRGHGRLSSVTFVFAVVFCATWNHVKSCEIMWNHMSQKYGKIMKNRWLSDLFLNEPNKKHQKCSEVSRLKSL